MDYKMKVDEIIEYCKKKRICEKGYKQMKSDVSIDNFCQLFYANSDWALENNIPTPQMLEIPDLINYGIYSTDYKGKAKEKMAFFQEAKAEIVAQGYDVVEVYARHNTEVHITAKDYAKVFVTVLDQAKVTIETLDYSEVLTFNR